MRSPSLLLLLICLLCLVTSSQSRASLRANTNSNAGDTQATTRALQEAGLDAGAEEEEARQEEDKQKEEANDKPENKEGNSNSEDKKKFEEEKEKAKKLAEEEKEETTEKEETATTTEAVTDATEDTTEEADTLLNLLSSAKNMTKNITKNINATAISLSACEQIEMTVSFLTSLDFDQDFWKVMNFTKAVSNEDASSRDEPTMVGRTLRFGGAIWEVYLLQLILLPVSLVTALFGSNLLHPTVCLAAAGMGIFLVFHLVDFVARSGSPLVLSLVSQIDCQMKLALGFVAALVSAVLASTFLRFGLFALGALAAGGGSYLVFDAFPVLDPTRDAVSYQDGNTGLHGQLSGELSPFAWLVTTLVGVFGGVFLRWFERAALETVTAALGGLGCAYSLHTFVTLQGGQLDRSLVFLIANFIAFFGWRFQRHRRIYRTEYAHKKNEEVVAPLLVPAPYYAPQQQQQQSAASWNQLQTSLNGLLQRPNNNSGAVPSEDQIVELTKSLNTLLTKMEKTESNVSNDSDAEDDKKS